MSKERINKNTNTDFSNYMYDYSKHNLKTNGSITITDVDFMYYNYKKRKFMLLEEKCKNDFPSQSQSSCLNLLDKFMSSGSHEDYEYMGLHTIIFENTSPKNGKMTFDGIGIDEEKFHQIMNFEADNYWYQTSKPYSSKLINDKKVDND